MNKERIRFLNLSIQNLSERKKLHQQLDRVMDHGMLINGPEVEELEAQFAQSTKQTCAVGVASGTDALVLALKAAGVTPGDEVITTSLSWIATANAIALCGAVPVFADVRFDLTIDPESVVRLITTKTKAVLPVHYTGRLCQMDRLIEICKRHNLILIEDCAQAFGAMRNRKPAGSFGEFSCFSMNSMKPLASLGEAGMICCKKPENAERIRILRYNGTIDKDTCVAVSGNSRLHTIQAAFILARINDYPRIQEARLRISKIYNQELAGYVSVPELDSNESSAWYTYTILADQRNELKKYLEEQQVEVKIHHPILMPDQPVYRECKNDAVEVRQLHKKILCLPNHEKLEEAEVERVIDSVRQFYGN